MINRIPVSFDVALHHTGTDPRTTPPITTYFCRKDGAALRAASSAKATMSPKCTFSHHVDTGGYSGALTATGHGEAEQLALFIEVDGSYFGGVVSPPACSRWPDRHLDIGKTSEVPNLKDKHLLNMASDDWIGISTHRRPGGVDLYVLRVVMQFEIG